jgi:hypothetical protein
MCWAAASKELAGFPSDLRCFASRFRHSEVGDIFGIQRTPMSEILSIRIAGQMDFDIFIPLQLCAGVAQLAEQLFCKQQVVGSSPSAGFCCWMHQAMSFPVHR